VTTTLFPPRPPPLKTVHVEANIPVSQLDEFELALVEIAGGERPRMDTLLRDEGSIQTRAILALQAIEANIQAHPTYPFDLTVLRSLDTRLANACLDYLNYDRLGKKEVHKHLANGDRELHRWLKEYGIESASARS
jgi:hypothetical protein